MKEIDIDYAQLLSIVDSKSLLLQFSESPDRYNLFAVEPNVSWQCVLLKNTVEAKDFENNRKNNSNKPLEYRSSDGLPKVASAKFSDNSTYLIDGNTGIATINANTIQYLKTHFSVPFKLAGVDVHWNNANYGDYILFEVGYYTNINNESTFVVLNTFANKYRLLGTGHQLFDVSTVSTIPPQVGPYDTYIRTTYVNTGAITAQLVVNLVGWK